MVHFFLTLNCPVRTSPSSARCGENVVSFLIAESLDNKRVRLPNGGSNDKVGRKSVAIGASPAVVIVGGDLPCVGQSACRPLVNTKQRVVVTQTSIEFVFPFRRSELKDGLTR